MKIAPKIIGIMGLLLLFSAIIILIIFNTLNNSLVEEIEKKQLSSVQEIMLSIDKLIFSAYRDIQIIANDKNVIEFVSPNQPNLPNGKDRLSRLGKLTGPWENIHVINNNGEIVSSTNQQSIGLKLSQAQNTISFNRALNGDIYYSGLIISEETSNPTIIFSAPVRDVNNPDHPIIGVVIGHFSWSTVIHFLEQIIQEVHLYNSQGYVIASSLSSDNKLILVRNDYSNPIVKDLLDGNTINIISTVGNQEILHSLAPQKGYLSYLGNGWGLIQKISTDSVFASTQRNLNLLFILSFLGFIFLIFVTFVITSEIIEPIGKLKIAAQNLQDGDFNSRVAVSGSDEFKQLGDSFNKTTAVLGKMNQQHQQLEHAKTEFLSITSHELRSPMTPMRGQLQMLVGDYFGKLNKKQKESINIVLRNTVRLDNIIQDFLEISRIEAARLKFNFIMSDLSQMVKYIVDEMKNFMPDKKIKIDNMVNKLPVIEVDPNRVGQVIRNLINNAIKFTPENGKITINASIINQKILFSIKDTGIGINPKQISRIFEPFFQGEQSMYRKFGGTGLGLAISRGIIESQGGELWVESKLNEGSTFYFTVPFTPLKEIKPIKLLFSKSETRIKEIEKLFSTMLGPIGKTEFQIQYGHGLSKQKLLNYVEELQQHGVINQEVSQEFISTIHHLLDKSYDYKSLPDQLEELFTQVLGPLGKKQFSKLKKYDYITIRKAISSLRKDNIISTIEARDILQKCSGIITNISKSRSSKNIIQNSAKNKKLIQVLVTRTFNLYGQVAITRANLIDGLEVDMVGKVKVRGNHEKILNQLKITYADMLGNFR